MTSLSATFVILGLLSYLLGRQRLAEDSAKFPPVLLGVPGFGLLAILSKENGALLPLYIGIIELTLFQASELADASAKKLKGFLIVTVALPISAGMVFLATHWNWVMGGYGGRDFTLPERLMTEARVLFLYLRWTIVPKTRDLGLFHDDIVTSHGLFDPATTLVASVGVVTLIGAAIAFRRRWPLFAFATLWYFASHVLESSVIPLELVHEHRNYLATYPLVLAAAILLATVAERLPRIGFGLPIAFAIALSAITFNRALDWSAPTTLRLALARNHPDSARSNYEAGLALMAVSQKDTKTVHPYYDQIKYYFERSASLDTTSVNGLFSMLFLNASTSHPIDENDIGVLTRRLSTIPLRFPVADAFQSLVGWLTNGDVHLSRTQLVSLFEAALSNPSIDARTSAALLSFLSSYYHNVAGDDQEAVSLAMAAIQREPSEPGHHLYLAALAQKLGNHELAANELEATKRGDTLGRYSSRARELEESIAAMNRSLDASGQGLTRAER
jgi:hypothetical protein